METAQFYQLAVSLGLGLLVGLQRQLVQQGIAGFRTFPLITLAGTLAAQLGGDAGGWLVAAGLVTLAILLVMGNVARMQGGHPEAGLTTEMAAVVMYLVGAFVASGMMAVAVAVGGVVALLLHFKETLHGFAERITDTDVRAIMQFALISLVILPVLPNETFGPYAALNPFHIWLMVVLIVGISLTGYIAYKLLGEKAGTLLAGTLGGLISSTAATVSYARRGPYYTEAAGLNAFVIMIAATVVFLRLFVEIAAVAPGATGELIPPLATVFAFNLLVCVVAYPFAQSPDVALPPQENPAELRPALVFGLIYAVVLFTASAARTHTGDLGLYVVALISGLPNLDAITLSMARMVDAGDVAASTGWRAMLIASLANLAFKSGVIAALGGRALFLRVAVMFALSAAATVAVLVLWPTA